MFAKMYAVIRDNLVLLLVVAACGCLIDLLPRFALSLGTGGYVGLLTMFCWVQYIVAYKSLHGTDPKGFPAGAVFKIILKDFATLVPPMVVTGLLFLGLTPSGSSTPETLQIGLLILCLVALWPATAALMGTWIPAGIYGKNASLVRAIGRGGSQFFRRATMLYLLVIGYIVVVFGVTFAAVGFDFATLINAPLTVPMVLASLISNFAQTCFLAMWTALDTRDYMESEEVGLGEKLVAVF